MGRADRLEAVEHVDTDHEAFTRRVFHCFSAHQGTFRSLHEEPHSGVSRAGGGAVRFIAPVQRDTAERAAFSGFRKQLHVK